MKAVWPLNLLVFSLVFAGCNSSTDSSATENTPENNPPTVPQLEYSIVATYPHDATSYTQGLEFYNGQLLEGTGLEGKSRLMREDLASGKAATSIKLDSVLFGEGITVLHDTLYQLTWRNNKVLVYDARNFKKLKELTLTTEGWGLTNNGKELIVTDGSSNLYFYEPATFRLLRTQGVTEGGTPAIQLNELEYINGFVYANQYQYPYILKIDPASGQVAGKLDLKEVVDRIHARYPGADVLNGIAYNPDTKKIYVTGKWWPELYEIQFTH